MEESKNWLQEVNPRRRQGFMRVNKLENKSHEENSNKERNENLKLKIETIDE